MKILVTGATHGLGRNAVDYLLAKAVPIIATGRDSRQGEILQQQNLTFVQAELSAMTPQQAQDLFAGVEAVWHCAAKSAPWGNYADFYNSNVLATQNLVELAGQNRVAYFVHISTPSLYFNFTHREQVTEQQVAAYQCNYYSQTKYLAEQVIHQAVLKYPQTKFIILRPRALFGPHDRVLLPRILQLLKMKHGQLMLPSGGTASMDFTYVLNVVHAMELALQQTHITSGSVFNISNMQPMQLKTVLEILLTKLNIEFTIQGVSYFWLDKLALLLEQYAKISHQEPLFTRYSIGALNFNMTLDCSQAVAKLGYQPVYAMPTAIEQTIKHFNSNYYGLDN